MLTLIAVVGLSFNVVNVHADTVLSDSEFGIFDLIQTAQSLNVTPDQKAQGVAIIKKYQPEAKQTIDLFLKSRKDLFEAIHNEPYNEDLIRAQFRKSTIYQEELVVLRSKVIHDFRQIGTPEQVEKINQAVNRFFDNVSAKITLLRTIADFQLMNIA